MLKPPLGHYTWSFEPVLISKIWIQAALKHSLVRFEVSVDDAVVVQVFKG